MLLIIGEDEDHSTNEVIQWLNYFKHPFYRLKKDVTYKIFEFSLNKNKLKFVIKNRKKRHLQYC